MSQGTFSIPSPEWLAVMYSLALRFELHQCFLFLTFAGLNLSLPPLQERCGPSYQRSGLPHEHCPREVS